MSAPVDNAARLQALDVKGSFIVQAPAGSGKTDLLIRRVLCLLLTVEQPEQVIAITFTRKAAAEMRNRIHKLLLAADRGDEVANDYEASARDMALQVLKRDAGQQWGLLSNPERLSLQTIDSLCAMLTRELPLTSTLGAPLAPEDNAQRLYLAAALQQIESALPQQGAAGEATRMLLAEFDNNLGRLQLMLADMLANRDQWGRLMHHADQREELEQSLQRVVEKRLQELQALMPACVDTRIPEFASYAASNIAGLFGADHESAVRLASLQALPTAVVEEQPVWAALAFLLLTNAGGARKRLTKAEGFPAPSAKKDLQALGVEKEEAAARKEAFGEILAELQDSPEFCKALHEVRGLPCDGYSDEQWEILENLLVLLQHSMAYLALEFAGSAKCDFTEIALKANLALGPEDEPTDLALSLDYKIQHLLVDEFQDTSYSQFRLFKKLVAGWEPGDGRTFFVVGDPMQSIYRFRDAEVALFGEAREHGIGQIPLQSLQLTVNFRSTPAIVDWCNESFSEIFPAHDDRVSGAVSFAASEAFVIERDATESETTTEAVCWHVDELESAQNPTSVTPSTPLMGRIDAQALSIAAVARQTLQTAGPDETAAMLVRSRNGLLDLFLALRNAGVPCRAVEMEALANRPVVADIRSLAFALMYPHDKVAWLSLLRAPWCGLTLTELHSLTEFESGRLSLWQTINDEQALAAISDESRQRLSRFVEVMTPAVRNARRDHLVHWVEACWMQLGGPAACAGQSDIEAAEVAILALLRLQQSGDLWSRKLVDEQLQKLFAPSAPPAGPHLQIMTIHKSKGLEFDTVLLPYLNRKPNADKGGLLNWFELVQDDETDCLLAPLDTRLDKGSQTKEPIAALIRSFHSQRATNETLRLLYVAATRARRSLHLFGSVKLKEGDVVPPTKGSLLGALWPIAETPVEAQLACASTEGASDANPQIESTADIPPDSNGDLISTSATADMWVLPTDWQMPVEVKVYDSPAGIATDPDEEISLDFLWAGIDASVIGTVVHEEFQTLCRPGHCNLYKNDKALWLRTLETRLLSGGVSQQRLRRAVTKVEKAMQNCLADDKGQWILDNSHQQAVAELPLTAWLDDELRNIIIDRMFVVDGTRWIIDYKTGDHRGGGLDKFLDNEQERYQPQLERYARIVTQIHPEPVMLGLYFPLVQGWRSWQPSISVAGTA